MRAPDRTDADRCCGNCVYFFQYYIRLPDDAESVTFVKRGHGECIRQNKKHRKTTDVCGEYMEYSPGLLEKIIISDDIDV